MDPEELLRGLGEDVPANGGPEALLAGLGEDAPEDPGYDVEVAHDPVSGRREISLAPQTIYGRVPQARDEAGRENNDSHFADDSGEGGRWGNLASLAIPGALPAQLLRAGLDAVGVPVGRPELPTSEDVGRLYRRWMGEVDPDRGDAPVHGRNYSGGESLGVGVAQGLTFNHADELLAQLSTDASTAPPVAGVPSSLLPSGQRQYDQELARTRAWMGDAQRAHPGFEGAGEFAGGAALSYLIPAPGAATVAGRVGQAAGIGAAMGGAAASGSSAAPAFSGEHLQDAAIGAGLGAFTGAVAQGLGEGAQGAVRSMARRAPQLQERADRLRVLTAMGATGGTVANPQVLRDAQRVPGGVPEVARVMRETGMAPMFGTTDDVAQAATSVAERSREGIRDVIEGVDDSGQRVSIGRFAARLEREADELARRPELEDVAEALRARAANYRARLPDDVSMAEAQQLVSDLGNLGNYQRQGARIPNADAAARASTRAMREQMDDAAQRAFAGQPLPESFAAGSPYRDLVPTEDGSTAIDAYRRLRRQNQVAQIIGENATTSAGRGDKNRLFGLMDSQAAQLGAQVAGGPGAVVAAGARRAIAGRGATTRATAAEGIAWLARRLQSSPQSFGPYARVLAPLARGDLAQLAANDFVLMQNDSRYRQMVEQMRAQDDEGATENVSP